MFFKGGLKKQKLKEFIKNGTVLQETLKKALQAETKEFHVETHNVSDNYQQ